MAPPRKNASSNSHQLSAVTKKKIEWFLGSTNESLTRRVGESARFACGHSLTETAQKEMPEAELSWQLNRQALTMDPSRTLFYKGDLDITDLTPADTGVYTCALVWDMKGVKNNVTLGLFSLQVESDSPTRYVFEEEPFQLHCHGEVIGALFPSATRQWLHNGTYVTSPAPTTADNATGDIVDRITRKSEGTWECHVFHSASDRVWKTAWYRIAVQSPPSVADRWYRRIVMERPDIALAVLGGIVLVAVVFFLLSCLKARNTEEDSEKKFQGERNGWEEVLSEHRGRGKLKPSDISSGDEEDDDVETDKEEEDEEEERSTEKKALGIGSGDRLEVYENESNVSEDDEDDSHDTEAERKRARTKAKRFKSAAGVDEADDNDDGSNSQISFTDDETGESSEAEDSELNDNENYVDKTYRDTIDKNINHNRHMEITSYQSGQSRNNFISTTKRSKATLTSPNDVSKSKRKSTGKSNRTESDHADSRVVERDELKTSKSAATAWLLRRLPFPKDPLQQLESRTVHEKDCKKSRKAHKDTNRIHVRERAFLSVESEKQNFSRRPKVGQFCPRYEKPYFGMKKTPLDVLGRYARHEHNKNELAGQRTGHYRRYKKTRQQSLKEKPFLQYAELERHPTVEKSPAEKQTYCHQAATGKRLHSQFRCDKKKGRNTNTSQRSRVGYSELEHPPPRWYHQPSWVSSQLQRFISSRTNSKWFCGQRYSAVPKGEPSHIENSDRNIEMEGKHEQIILSERTSRAGSADKVGYATSCDRKRRHGEFPPDDKTFSGGLSEVKVKVDKCNRVLSSTANKNKSLIVAHEPSLSLVATPCSSDFCAVLIQRDNTTSTPSGESKCSEDTVRTPKSSRGRTSHEQRIINFTTRLL
ncbi:uncharacterized protein LOC101859623 [Aplysia californica]|uniref:Uncharacterized protein LOC101859623 n=1 Tax=Aplysia californica TaxID=6500 RepID=A0ABM0JF50_APLCA|nr:uncharacterized protein LOC101859623 [Aplysia californica]